MDCTEGCFILVGGGAIFRYTEFDCTEDCCIQVGGVEQSSGIMRWTVLKIVLYRFMGGALLMYTAVGCTDDCFIQVGGGSNLQV